MRVNRLFTLNLRLHEVIPGSDGVAFHCGLAASGAGWVAAAFTDSRMRDNLGPNVCVAHARFATGLLAAGLNLCALLELTPNERQEIGHFIGEPVLQEPVRE